MESGTSETFSKGSRVEVSSDEDGFKGAWYVATILESPPKSVSKKKSKALVEYQDLVADDAGSEPLTELVDTSFLRPLPPLEADANFCVNDLVDAFYRDGWWTGVITRISEDSKCTVFFQNPPDEIQFDRSDLRVHKEWVDGKWVRPEKQRTTGLIFSPGAAVEVTLNDQHDAWFPAIVCREIGLGSYVVQCQSLKNSGETGVLDVTVDNLHIRPSPPRLEGRKFGLLEKVDAFYDYGWWNGIVTKVLTGRRYVVFFKHTNIEKEFIHSDLRPHMEWVDGKWVGATQEVLGTTYSEEQLGHVLNNSNNTAVGIPLESSGAAIDDAGDKISHSTRSEKDRLEQPALYVENSTFVVTSNKKKMKETSSDDATPSRPSKKLKEGNVADAVMSHAAGQSRMSPIQTSIQEVPCGFATPIMGGTGSNQTEQPVPGNQFITKTGSPSQRKKIGNEQKSSELGNQSSNSVRRKGRPPKSHKIAQNFPAGEEAYTVQNAEGTAEKEHTTNNVDMDMAAGLPSNTDEATLAENPSHHLDESLNVMRYQKKDLNTTERLMSQETVKNEEGTVSTQLKRRGRPPKRLGKKNLETSSGGRAPGVLFKKSPKASSTGRSPKLPLKRSPRTSTREPKHPRASAVGTKQKGPKASSEGSNFNKQQMEFEAGLDLNSPDASAAGKDDNEVVGGSCEIAMMDCMMNEVETPMSTVAQSSARRGSRTENAGQHSRRPYNRRHSTDQKPLGRPKNVQGSKTRTPRTRKQKLPDGSGGQASSKQLEKSSSKRGRRKSININSVPPTQGAQDALGETTAPVVEKDSKAKQVEMAVDGVHCVPDDQPLSMWLEGMHSPGMADNSKLSPDQTVIQWTEASGKPKPIEVTQSPRIDPTGEIMLDLNQSLPFVKCSSIWNTLETLEVFQKMPQKPHFRPLENCKEERREGLAIGNMVTFSTLIEKVAKLKFDDPRSLFSSSLEALVDLEMHGFDIKPVQRRINELVFIKDQQEQLKGKTKEVEDQITEHTHEKTKIDEEIYEIDKKMILLQEKRAVAMAKKESKDSDIAALLSSVDAMNESIQTGRQDFERLATSPW